MDNVRSAIHEDARTIGDDLATMFGIDAKASSERGKRFVRVRSGETIHLFKDASYVYLETSAGVTTVRVISRPTDVSQVFLLSEGDWIQEGPVENMPYQEGEES